MNRRPTAPGGAVVGVARRRGSRLGRRLSRGSLMVFTTFAVACAESATTIVSITGEATTLTITVSDLGSGQTTEPLALEMGDSVSLTATATNALGLSVAAEAVTWSSSDSSVADVGSTGLVKAVGQGRADIYAEVGGAAAVLPVLVNETATTIPPAAAASMPVGWPNSLTP